MPHDERMLKTAFKTYGKNMSNAPLFHKRGTNLSQTPYVNKTFDMKGGSMHTPAQMSPELDRNGEVDDKYKK